MFARKTVNGRSTADGRHNRYEMWLPMTHDSEHAYPPEFPDGRFQAMLPSLRGIITACNAAGVEHDLTTLRKWIRLNNAVYKVDRIDMLVGADQAHLWRRLDDFALAERIKLCPRFSSLCPREKMQPVLDAKPHDVCIEHAVGDVQLLADWLTTLRAAAIPARVLLVATPDVLHRLDALEQALTDAKAVTIAAFDPFISCNHAADARQSAWAATQMNTLARSLGNTEIDACIAGLPFCHIDEDNLPLALNREQFFLDHLQYHQDAYVFAERMYRFRSCRVATAIENLLARRTSVHNLIDAALFPWIQDYPRLYIRIWMYHKLTRLLWFMQRKPRPLPETLSACEYELKRYRAEITRTQGNPCAQCRHRRICDYATLGFRTHFPGLEVTAQPGDALVAAPAVTQPRKRYYDDLDSQRKLLPQRLSALADYTRHLITHTEPTREISADTYDVLGRYTHHMPGAVRWLSFDKGELESTVLARLEPPFTLSLTLGGGIAAHAGFSFGRHAKILCPMIDYSHRITLSIDKDGYYVLLRDGQIVRPAEFESGMHLPARLGGVLEPRISFHNIDGMVLTQTVLLWEDVERTRAAMDEVKYSVIIVSTRYTRRLQAALLALAHQQGISPRLFEVVVGYVPGIDATDDLLDGIEKAFPEMRIVRSPFDEGRARSKGFMINESLRAASGEWVLLMDADIVLPPNTFAKLEAIEKDRHFIAPEGRKMLSYETTGRILLNEVRPWECYEEIMQEPGEIRKREADATPIGFFQCVRRAILARIPYHELDHFEASDWHFGRDVVARYGKEYRLENFFVLHLDHGGSQWYGTYKHR